MKDYIREDLTITEFDMEDVITTSGISGGTTPGGSDSFSPGSVGEDYYPFTML